jgi:hypothetical protein
MSATSTAHRRMTAKYPGRCAGCGQNLSAGSQIEFWGPGCVTHTWCAPTSAPRQASSPRPSASARRYENKRTGCSCGSVEGYTKPTDCWTCKHDAE